MTDKLFSKINWSAWEPAPLAKEVPKYDGLFFGEDYRGFGEQIIRFVENHCWNLNSKTNLWEPVTLTEEQVIFFREAYETDSQGNLKHTTILDIGPRREGKTQRTAWAMLYFACNYPNQALLSGSNSLDQTEETTYRWLWETISNSPAFQQMERDGLIHRTKGEIRFLIPDSVIMPLSSSSSSAMGRRTNFANVTELGEAADANLFNALAGGTGDALNPLMVVDSVVGTTENIVWQLIKNYEAGLDESLYVHYKRYASLEEALEKAPPWISRKWLRSRASQMMPADFKRYHLNLPPDGADKMFTVAQVNLCIVKKVSTPIPTAWIDKHIRSRSEDGALLFAASIDKAQSYSKEGDRTVLTLGAKGFLKKKYRKKLRPIIIIDEQGNRCEIEPEPYDYWIIDQPIIANSSDRESRRYLNEWNERHNLTIFVPEKYETDSLSHEAEYSGIPTLPVSPVTPNQKIVFNMFYEAVAQGRFHFPANLWLLFAELLAFEYEYKSKNVTKFGHAHSFKTTLEINGERKATRIKDDSIYSGVWWMFGLRDVTEPPVSSSDISFMNQEINAEPDDDYDKEIIFV